MRILLGTGTGTGQRFGSDTRSWDAPDTPNHRLRARRGASSVLDRVVLAERRQRGGMHGQGRARSRVDASSQRPHPRSRPVQQLRLLQHRGMSELQLRLQLPQRDQLPQLGHSRRVRTVRRLPRLCVLRGPQRRPVPHPEPEYSEQDYFAMLEALGINASVDTFDPVYDDYPTSTRMRVGLGSPAAGDRGPEAS